MVEIKARLKIARSAYKLEVKGRLELPFALRRQSRLDTQLASGEKVALRLPAGEILRGGDLVTASDGRVIEVVAEPEKLLQVNCASAAQLARLAWQLGGEHVAVEVGEGFLRVAADAALAEKLKKSGVATMEVEAPFEPEVEAGAPHDHGHGDHDHEHHHKH
ncbi:MAG: urease accessory protein UreE [Proteobacteria bacterium]|nr:urease accessory protein UreE [Pseudomonadota bacterium]